MPDKNQIVELLARLEHCTADALERQDLDFKEWSTRSRKDALT